MPNIVDQKNNGYISIKELAEELDVEKIDIIRIKKNHKLENKISIISLSDADIVRNIINNQKEAPQLREGATREPDGLAGFNLKINSIEINNFKSYSKLTYLCNKAFNVIMGENNIGKSTIFDAILLWEIAYNKLITTGGSFYKPIKNHDTITVGIGSLKSLRVVSIDDIFKDESIPCYISLKMVTPDSIEYKLKINFEKPINDESRLLISIDDSFPFFNDFYSYCQQHTVPVRNAFSIKLSQPVANITRNEYYFNDALIKQKSNTGYSSEVLRNKILNTMESKKFLYLEEKLESVLNKQFKIRWKNENKDADVNIRLTISESGGQEVDLSLVGSGILNLLEIFSSLYSTSKGVNLVLLDEPDSHVHNRIQSKLIEQLKYDSLSSQVFIITHNDRLIHTVEQEELFYLSQGAKNQSILDYFPMVQENVHHIKHQMSGDISRLEEVYKNKPVLFVEGKTDKIILEAVIKNNFPRFQGKINIECDNGHSGVADMIITWHLKRVNNRAAALFDNDIAVLPSIGRIEEAAPNEKERNFKIYKLREFLPEHLVQFYKQSIKLPFAIEEMFSVDLWDELNSQGMLSPKTDIDKSKSPMDKSFLEHCLDCGIDRRYLIYLNKVTSSKKMKAAKYLVSKINQTDTEKLAELVRKVLCYLLFIDENTEFSDYATGVRKSSELAVNLRMRSQQAKGKLNKVT